MQLTRRLTLLSANEDSWTVLVRVKAVVVALAKRWGPARLRHWLWDSEFSVGQWDNLETTYGDFLYGVLRRHARGGAILDMGCGSGNTGNELEVGCYRRYVGVDISSVAVDRARERSAANGRDATNRYVVGDLESYEPPERFEVVLFRESLYYVPIHRLGAVLDRYMAALAENGVVIVRLWSRSRHADLVAAIVRRYDLVEEVRQASSEATVLVFRPTPSSASSRQTEVLTTGTGT